MECPKQTQTHMAFRFLSTTERSEVLSLFSRNSGLFHLNMLVGIQVQQTLSELSNAVEHSIKIPRLQAQSDSVPGFLH